MSIVQRSSTATRLFSFVVILALASVNPLATHAQSVTISLKAEVNGNLIPYGATPIVTPGDMVDWSIYATVSPSDNSGLASINLEFFQFSNNRYLFDIPAASGVPAGMEAFSRPMGLSNPGQYGAPTGYVGWQAGVTSKRNLIQIGGAQNTTGLVNTDLNGMPNTTTLSLGIGQSTEPQLIVSGSFEIPVAGGEYTYGLRNAKARVLELGPPTSGSVVTTVVTPTLVDETFRFKVVSIFDVVHYSHGYKRATGYFSNPYGLPIYDRVPPTYAFSEGHTYSINSSGVVAFEADQFKSLSNGTWSTSYDEATVILRRSHCDLTKSFRMHEDLLPFYSVDFAPEGNVVHVGFDNDSFVLTDANIIQVSQTAFQDPPPSLPPGYQRSAIFVQQPLFDCEGEEELFARWAVTFNYGSRGGLQELDEFNDIQPPRRTVLGGNYHRFQRNKDGVVTWINSLATSPPLCFNIGDRCYPKNEKVIARTGQLCPFQFEVAAHLGQAVPGSSDFLHDFDSVFFSLNETGDIAFSALLRTNEDYDPQIVATIGDSNRAILRIDGEDLVLVARDHMEVYTVTSDGPFELDLSSFISGYGYAAYSCQLNEAGQIAFISKVLDNTGAEIEAVLVENSSGEIQAVLMVGDNVPSLQGPTTITNLHGIEFNDLGEVAIHADVSIDVGIGPDLAEEGIWVWSANGLRRIMMTGDAAPGYDPGVIFDRAAVHNDGQPFVVLLGFLNTGEAYFVSTVSGPDYSFSNGYNNGKNRAIWMMKSDDQLKRIVAEDEKFESFLGTIERISDIRIPKIHLSRDDQLKFLNQSGQFLIDLAFEDGTDGLYIAHTLGRKDCNANGISDELELCFNDCNNDGIPDDCQWIDNNADGVMDECEICPGADNSIDTDCDTIPDACDICEGFDDRRDDDCDGVPNDCDNCIITFNPLQEDCDYDGVGDACAPDEDENGIPDACQVRYVDVSNTNTQQDGRTWETAYTTIQPAIDDWANPEMVVESIHIAAGTYLPEYDFGNQNNPRDLTFWIPPGVDIFGGYPSGGGLPEVRDPNLYLTTLSGDLGNDDQPDGSGKLDNSYCVLTLNHTVVPEKEDGTVTTIDGVTISGGYSGDIVNAVPGAGVQILDQREVVISRCEIVDNHSGGGGGGLFAMGDGSFGDPYLFVINSRINNNSAIGYGGGMLLHALQGLVLNSEIAQNSASQAGGIGIEESQHVQIVNCSVVGNSADTTGGGLALQNNHHVNVHNSVLYGNLGAAAADLENEQISWDDGFDISMQYCLVHGVNVFANYNIDGEPHFYDFPSNLRLFPESECINAGSNTLFNNALDLLEFVVSDVVEFRSDLDGIDRLDDNGTVDIGAYEFRHIVKYVNANHHYSGTGNSWSTAYQSLGNAIEVTKQIKGLIDIRVARGVYFPETPVSGDRRDGFFELRSGLRLFGGYRRTAATYNQPEIVLRDPLRFQTVLSGDFNQDDSGNIESRIENARRLVVASHSDRGAIFDGFTIQGANLNSGIDVGAGLLIDGGNPQISDCHFRDNICGEGAGLAIINAAAPQITTCRISENAGSGIFIENSSPLISRCAFVGNRAAVGGGIQIMGESAPTISDSLIIANQAEGPGGAIYIENAQPYFIRTSVLENESVLSYFSAGIHTAGPVSYPTILHSIVASNRSDGQADFDAQLSINDGTVAVESSAIDDGSPGNGLTLPTNGTYLNLTDVIPTYTLDRDSEFESDGVFLASSNVTELNPVEVIIPPLQTVVSGHNYNHLFPDNITPIATFEWVTDRNEYFVKLDDGVMRPVVAIAYEVLIFPAHYLVTIGPPPTYTVNFEGFIPERRKYGRAVDSLRVAGNCEVLGGSGDHYRLIHVIPTENSGTVDFVATTDDLSEDLDLSGESRLSLNNLLDLGAFESYPCEYYARRLPGDADTSDIDEDGVIDACDNCPLTANSQQEDSDSDGIGDACDICVNSYGPSQSDSDIDGFGNECDNCPYQYNTSQLDQDNDGIGDVCDNCVMVANSSQSDLDDNGVGDACDCWTGTVPCGACCYWSERDGAKCIISSEVLCDYLGGAWSFNDTCVEFDCEYVTGTCCLFEGTVSSCEVISPLDCDAMGGRWRTGICDSSSCELGHCCYYQDGKAACDVLTESQCLLRDSGSWIEGIVDHSSISCDSHGRCCNATDTTYCKVMSKADCTAQNGQSSTDYYWTWGVSCSVQACIFGHCCFVDAGKDMCLVTIEADCDSLSGTWEEGLTCAEVTSCESHGRCCRFYDGQAPICVMTSRSVCEIDQFSFWSHDEDCASSACTTPGSCCYDSSGNLLCEFVAEEVCVFLGGSWNALVPCEQLTCE